MGPSWEYALPGYSSRASWSTLLVVLAGCGAGHIDTDTPLDSDSEIADTPSDTSDTGEEPGPCGPGAPADCEEVVDGVCWSPVPRPPGFALTDEQVTRIVQVNQLGYGTCGYSAIVACGEFLTLVEIPPDGWTIPPNDEIVLESTVAYSVRVFRASDRAELGFGMVHTSRIGTPCYRMYYGERAGLECFRGAVLDANASYEACSMGGACDACGCRINQLTDARHPECSASPE